MLDMQKKHDLLLQWEQQDGGWTDEVREECIAFMSESTQGEAYWKELLEPVPDDILIRYRKLIQMMKDERLLDEEQICIEEHHARTLGGKLLHKRGKTLAAELKSKRDTKKYIDIIPHECR
jgi:hypothetical protein